MKSNTTEMEGIFEIEAWDGDPNDPKSKVRKTYKGMNALTPDFKDYLMEAFRRNAGYMGPVINTAGGNTLPDAFFTERKFTRNNVGSYAITSPCVYLTEEDSIPVTSHLRNDTTVQGSTGMEISRLYSHTYNTAKARPYTVKFFNGETFNRPSGDLQDTNIVDIIRSNPTALETFLVDEEKNLRYSNFSYFNQLFPASGVINVIGNAYSSFPLEMFDNKTLEWVLVYATTTTHAPLGVNINAKHIGVTTSFDDPMLYPITYHKIAEGFDIKPTDYLKISYRVLVKQSMTMPESVKFSTVEVFGKPTRIAEVTMVAPMSTYNQYMSSAVMYQVPEYRAMVKRLATQRYNAETAEKIEAGMIAYGTTWSNYYRDATLPTLMSCVLGMCIPVGVVGRGTNSSTNMTVISPGSFIADSATTLMNKHTDIGMEAAYTSFLSSADYSSTEEFTKEFNKLASVVNGGSARYNFIGNGGLEYAIRRAQISGVSATVSPTTAPIPFSNTYTTAEGTITNTIINAPATSQHVWTSRGWSHAAGSIMRALNFTRFVFFEDALIKDHLNSFVVRNTNQVYTAGSTVDDSGAFLDEIRSKEGVSYAKSTLLAYDNQ